MVIDLAIVTENDVVVPGQVSSNSVVCIHKDPTNSQRSKIYLISGKELTVDLSYEDLKELLKD